MYNYTSTAISLLVRMKLLSPDAGRYLNENLQSKIHTARYDDSYDMVDQMLKDFEEKDKITLMEPWMPYIRKLEREIAQLEKKVTEATLTAKK
jgi:hypothetical protein